MSFNLFLALAVKRVALGKSQAVAGLDVSIALLHVEMKVEVCIKMDTDTLRLIREENYSTIKVSTKWTKPCPDIEAHYDSGRTPCQRQRETILCTWTRKVHSGRARGRRTGTISFCVTWYES